MQEQASPASSGPSSSMEEETGPAKTFTLPSIQYIIYTDSELELCRKHYFELKKVGRGGELSKELSCKLVRNTITNMLSIVRASDVEDFIRYPTKEDLQTKGASACVVLSNVGRQAWHCSSMGMHFYINIRTELMLLCVCMSSEMFFPLWLVVLLIPLWFLCSWPSNFCF